MDKFWQINRYVSIFKSNVPNSFFYIIYFFTRQAKQNWVVEWRAMVSHCNVRRNNDTVKSWPRGGLPNAKHRHWHWPPASVPRTRTRSRLIWLLPWLNSNMERTYYLILKLPLHYLRQNLPKKYPTVVIFT